MKDSRISKALSELTNLNKASRYLKYNDIDCCAEKYELNLAEFDKLSNLLISMGFLIIDKVENGKKTINNFQPKINKNTKPLKSSLIKDQTSTYDNIEIGTRVLHRVFGKGTIDGFNRTGSFNVVFENKGTKKFQLDSFEKGVLHIID